MKKTAYSVFLAAWACTITGVASAQGGTAKSPWSVNGNVQLEAAHIVASPERWSTLRLATEVGLGYRVSEEVRAKVVAQFASNVAPHVEDGFYDVRVRKDLDFNASVREAFVEFPIAGLGARIGKQSINWGEAVGVFVADVVNARDLREFLLPELDQVRIAQWAARLDWQGDDKSAELIWIPVPLFDRIGEPGGDFYPVIRTADGLRLPTNALVKPARKVKNSNVGARVGFINNGWDVAAFAYRSMDRETVFAPKLNDRFLSVTPMQGARITQIGGTLSKDLEFAVLKSELVFTAGKALASSSPSALTGLTKRDVLDWVVGMDIPIAESDIRVNVQVIDRRILDHDASVLENKRNTFGSLQVVVPAGAWEWSVLGIEGLGRNERLWRPKVAYKLGKNTRITLGADFFDGTASSLLGQFESNDRVYVRVKHSF
jgi:hypothetical protein